MKNKQKRSGIIFVIIGILLLAAALGKTAYNLWDGVRAGRESQEIAQQLIKELPETTDTQKNEKIDTDESEANEDDTDREEMKTVDLDGNRYLGLICIPSIDLELPVMAEWSYEKLRTAPCRYTGSIYDNNLVIAGHNYSGHFRDLKELKRGAEINLITASGEEIIYTVKEIETLGSQEISSMITADDWDLTLFTCTVGGKSRCTVRCIRE